MKTSILTYQIYVNGISLFSIIKNYFCLDYEEDKRGLLYLKNGKNHNDQSYFKRLDFLSLSLYRFAPANVRLCRLLQAHPIQSLCFLFRRHALDRSQWVSLLLCKLDRIDSSKACTSDNSAVLRSLKNVSIVV